MIVIPSTYDPCDFASHVYLAMRHQRRLVHDDLAMKLRLFHSPGATKSTLLLSRATAVPSQLPELHLRRRVYAQWNGWEYDLIVIDHPKRRRGIRVSLRPMIHRGQYEHLIPRKVRTCS